jgi:hypothetical protein
MNQYTRNTMLWGPLHKAKQDGNNFLPASRNASANE